MTDTTRSIATGSLFLLLACLLWPATAGAEPYLAVQQGAQCSRCHSHPAGGGLRTSYGNVFAQNELAAERLGGTDAELWTGRVTEWLSAGADLRAGYRHVEAPNIPTVSEFRVFRGAAYAQAEMIPGRLLVYVDQQFAPDSNLNREAYVRFNGSDGRWHLLAGQFFLPYGWRLQDDTAFIRQATGINFFSPDRGIQLGYEAGPWSTQLSLTNGSGGGTETDTGKRGSWTGQFVQKRWRAGASLSYNDADAGSRRMQNLFFGWRTGPVAWLAEADLIVDELPSGGDRDSVAGLLEANWLYRRGHNLKVTFDYLDPDRDVSEDHQTRWSLLWEYTPVQFLQARFGARVYDGVPQNDFQNRDEYFVELHGFF